jgi:hypothetical protein
VPYSRRPDAQGGLAHDLQQFERGFRFTRLLVLEDEAIPVELPLDASMIVAESAMAVMASNFFTNRSRGRGPSSLYTGFQDVGHCEEDRKCSLST